jgi:hypothetical protein
VSAPLSALRENTFTKESAKCVSMAALHVQHRGFVKAAETTCMRFLDLSTMTASNSALPEPKDVPGELISFPTLARPVQRDARRVAVPTSVSKSVPVPVPTASSSQPCASLAKETS